MTPGELEQLVAKHGPTWRMIASQGSDAPDDCVQEALLRLIREEPKPKNVFAWVTRVIRNLAASGLRQKQTRLKHQPELETRALNRNEKITVSSLDWVDVKLGLEDLPASNKDAVVMKVWGGMTFAEIAEALECSVTSAHRCFQEGLEQLRQNLDDRELPSPLIPVSERVDRRQD